jgi:hypothetical protein
LLLPPSTVSVGLARRDWAELQVSAGYLVWWERAWAFHQERFRAGCHSAPWDWGQVRLGWSVPAYLAGESRDFPGCPASPEFQAFRESLACFAQKGRPRRQLPARMTRREKMQF